VVLSGHNSILRVCGFCLIAASPAASADTAADWWTEHVAASGDLRLRYQSIRRSPGADDDRERYRARAGVVVDASDHIEVGLRFATSAGDPASRNLNFGDSFSLDNVRVDRAYLAWSAHETLQLTGGKMKNPFFRAGDNALMWDSDVTPEGVAANFESGNFFATVSGFIVDDRAGVEARLFAVQGGTKLELSDEVTLTAGVGWYDYTDIAGHPPLVGDNTRGNSVDALGNYLYDFDIVEVFAEYTSSVAGWPVSLFAEWTRNTQAAVGDTAYSVGINAGQGNEAGDLELSWAWRDTEADALVGIFTDSNLAGGSTDSRGHVLSAFYRATNHVGLKATFIVSEYGLLAGSRRDFDTVMLDIEFIF
jgi:hypothetical protein